ncbi:MAG TPA: polynucleotide kinase-phosphatase [Gemmata sp.]|jgi:protein phosphatase|nr:polynucleotide kinase-phosphatase [Gemmata sp.]
MTIPIPEFALVLLIGPSGCGKSTFARRHFKPTEVLSSDFFRAILADDDTDQTVSADAFELLHLVCAKRLAAGRLTVIDATNVRRESRKPFVEMARKYHVQLTAVAFNFPADFCHARNQQRPDRTFGPHVTRRQVDDLKRSLGKLEDEGFRRVFVLNTEEEVSAADLKRYPLPVNKRDDRGPFDIIGDVHGCLTELLALFEKLGYTLQQTESGWQVEHPVGRKPVFVGDLGDRGPDTPGVYRLVMNLLQRGAGYCVLGNHDDKLLRWLKGERAVALNGRAGSESDRSSEQVSTPSGTPRAVNKVKLNYGLEQTVAQLAPEPQEFRDRLEEFILKLPSHLVLDGGRLVVAHAGLTAEMHGRISGKVRAFALYGDTTGESDEFGLPVRLNWAANYRGRATVVYGHTPTPTLEWVNRCICIDTGCVFGGALTALRYPEQELVSVPAAREYAVPKRPFLPSESTVSQESIAALTSPVHTDTSTQQQQADDLLDLADVTGRRLIETRFAGKVTIREENAAAALEVMSRFAADPHWLIYLPPTMSPVEASPLPDFLEHPAEAFDYFRQEGIDRIVCEQKHMGSRAIAIVCRDEAAAKRRFGVNGESGIVYTRTGRRFFDDPATEAGFLGLVRDALTRADWWMKFNTDWVALDGELMPWSAKAQELLRRQYAATGSAARAALAEVVGVLSHSNREGGSAMSPVVGAMASPGLTDLRARFTAKVEAADRFVAAYRQYCWPVNSLADLKFAPFFLLATEGKVYFDHTHDWHMRTLAELAGDLLLATPFRVVDLTDSTQTDATTQWWLDLTNSGGEGMVVKPFDVLTRGRRFFVQPALKVRGREYLRIIYGPDYLMPENLSRLKHRAVGSKRGLAAREFGLGLEGLERFVNRVPLRQVHECTFAILALESEPIDPRL